MCDEVFARIFQINLLNAALNLLHFRYFEIYHLLHSCSNVVYNSL